MVTATSGCAARRAGFAQKFVKPGEPTIELGDPPAPRQSAVIFRSTRGSCGSCRPRRRRKRHLLPTIESRDPVLERGAVAGGCWRRHAANHRLVAAAYRRAGVADYAFRHYQRALRLDSCDSAALQGIAQLWRDWGMPDLALGDAYRAVSCQPKSPAAPTTRWARCSRRSASMRAQTRAYERALLLDDRGRVRPEQPVLSVASGR